MTVSNHKKILKQIKGKPAKVKRYEKYNVPKERSCGKVKNKCRRCGRSSAHIGKYGLKLCRTCFKEIATKIGFKKFN
jgi:small subunit ribosomal protein S14